MVSVAYKDIVTRLSEAIKSLTQKNASLAAQLSDAIRLDLDMAKKLNFKLKQEHKDKRLAEKANRKSAFEKNLDVDGYC